MAPRKTPQDELRDAVRSRYPVTADFFKAVAKETQIAPESAKGTFYGFLRGNETSRPLPDTQRQAYLKLTGIKPSVLDKIAAAHPQAATPRGRDHLAQLVEEIKALTEALEAAKEAHRRLQRRVSTLEKAKSRARTRPLRVTQAKRRGRKTA